MHVRFDDCIGVYNGLQWFTHVYTLPWGHLGRFGSGALSEGDKLATELNDIKDVEEKCPGVISGIREWCPNCTLSASKPPRFRWYKTPDGKPLNAFGYEDWALEEPGLWSNYHRNPFLSISLYGVEMILLRATWRSTQEKALDKKFALEVRVERMSKLLGSGTS